MISVKFYFLYYIQNSSKNIFYVGVTTDSLKRRLQGHQQDTKLSDSLKSQTLSAIQQLGLEVEIELIEEGDFNSLKDAYKREQKLIRSYAKKGHKLTNVELARKDIPLEQKVTTKRDLVERLGLSDVFTLDSRLLALCELEDEDEGVLMNALGLKDTDPLHDVVISRLLQQ
jgi:predicted GIY-YIG superfamily endonuclease